MEINGGFTGVRTSYNLDNSGAPSCSGCILRMCAYIGWGTEEAMVMESRLHCWHDPWGDLGSGCASVHYIHVYMYSHPGLDRIWKF